MGVEGELASAPRPDGALGTPPGGGRAAFPPPLLADAGPLIVDFDLLY
jgi:hypothetical protein